MGIIKIINKFLKSDEAWLYIPFVLINILLLLGVVLGSECN